MFKTRGGGKKDFWTMFKKTADLVAVGSPKTSDLQFLVNILHGRVSDLSNVRHAQLLNLRDQLQAKVL